MEYMKVWTSFLDIVEPLSDDELGRLFRMMMIYTSTGQEPAKFAGNERYLWPTAKQQIDLAASKVEKLRENGLKGGRPSSNINQEKANESKEKQSETNESLNINVNNNVNVKVKNNKKIFIPPTIDEVADYCKGRNNGIDAEYFVSYYQKQDWFLSNGRKMKDWKAAIITWEKNDKKRQFAPVKKVVAQQYTQRDYENEDSQAFERMLERAMGVKE